MTQMIVQSIESLVDYQEVKNKLIQQWTIRHNTPNIFRYKLNVRKQKRLSGLLNLYVEVSELLFYDINNCKKSFIHFFFHFPS